MEREIRDVFQQISGFVIPLQKIIYEYAIPRKLRVMIEDTSIDHTGYCSAPQDVNTLVRREVAIVDIPYWMIATGLELPLGDVDLTLLRQKQFADYEYDACPYGCNYLTSTKKVIEADIIATEDVSDQKFSTFPSYWYFDND